MFDNFTTILGNNPYDLDSVSTKLCRILSDSKYLNINVGGDVEGDFWFCVLRCFLFDDESINLNALLKLSKYIRKHYKSSKISGNGLKYNEIKYRVTATSTFTGDIIINNPVGNSDDLAKELMMNLPNAFQKQMYTNLK